jgi:hypothetical protein
MYEICWRMATICACWAWTWTAGMMLTVHLGLSCTNSCGAMDGWMVCVFDIRLFAEANNGILFLWPLFSAVVL